MDNDVSNELNEYRRHRLAQFTDQQVSDAVINALREIDATAWHGLQGIDAERDGITREMWDQCLIAADMNGSLVYGVKALLGQDLTGLDAVPFHQAVSIVARQVANAILVVNFYRFVN